MILMKIFSIILCLGLLFGCQKEEIISENKADMSEYSNLKSENHSFVVSTMEELFKNIEEKKNGTYYIGYADCPWCQDGIPVLDEAAKEMKKEVYYIEMSDKNKKVLITKEEEAKFVGIASEHLEVDETGEKTLYVPFVFTLKDGKIVSAHTGTVESYKPSEREMTVQEESELKEIYRHLLK